MITTSLLVVIGCSLIALVTFDIFTTVLHPSVESPLSNRFQRLVWRVLRTIATSLGTRPAASHVLNWGLPLMVAGLIALWLVVLVLGFACICYPWIDTPEVFVSGKAAAGPVSDALYYSGVTLATLGYGDIEPLTGIFRLLAVLEALIGVVTISAGVAYILSVYPALTQQQTLAIALDAEVAGQTDALPLVRRYVTGAQVWSGDLNAQLRDISLGLLTTTESHELYPVLYYAHPPQVQHSFLRMLITAQSLVTTLRYGLSPQAHSDIVTNPQVLLLEQALHYSLRRLNASRHVPPLATPDPHSERRRLVREYIVLCRDLAQLGLTPARGADRGVPVLVATETAESTEETEPETTVRAEETFDYTGDPDILDPALDLSSESPLEAFVVFRMETDTCIAAYATVSGYDLQTARADHTTSWWTGR